MSTKEGDKKQQEEDNELYGVGQDQEAISMRWEKRK